MTPRRSTKGKITSWCKRRRYQSQICCGVFFANYTIHRRHLQRTHTHPYEYTHANPTPRSIFEGCAGKSSRLTKSPQAPRCRRERRLPLKAQASLNPENSLPRGVLSSELVLQIPMQSRWYYDFNDRSWYWSPHEICLWNQLIGDRRPPGLLRFGSWWC
jgi:hypothetical protein